VRVGGQWLWPWNSPFGRVRPRLLAREEGFSILESVLALGVIFSVLVGLAGVVDVGVRGVVLSRQRVGATTIANNVLEQARGRAYAEVGHDFDDDPTLTSDSNITGALPSFSYQGELLAPSSINSASNSPFTPHRWTTTNDGTPYTVNVYITQVIPNAATGDPYKHVTVSVSWSKAQYAAAATVANSVVASTILYNGIKPPNPWLDGVVDADGGSFDMTGTLIGIDLGEGQVWFPYTHGEVHSRDIQDSKGYASTTHSELRLNSGTATGCVTSNGGSTASCAGLQASSVADDDAGTTPPEYDKHTVTDAGHSVAGGSPLSLTFGASNSGTAESAARSKAASYCSGVLGNDSLPFQCSDAVGPASLASGFSAGPVVGNLVGSSATARSTSTVDRTDVPGASRLSAVGKTTMPALDFLTLTGAPSGFLGLVKVSAAAVTATANSGIGVAAPSVTGGAVTVQMFDSTLAIPGYRTVFLTPGTASTNTSTATLSIGGATVNMTTTVVTQPAVTSSTTDASGAITHAEASIASWLDVAIHLTITTGGATQADLTYDFDYGRLSAAADYKLN